MQNGLAILTAGAMAAAFLGAASPTAAETVHHSYAFETRMVEQQPGVGEFDGSLQLDVSPRGIISGYYRPADNAQFIPVSGGLSGDKLWLDIGTFARRPMHFNGTLSDGKIDAVSDQPLLDDGAYASLKLLATPAN